MDEVVEAAKNAVYTLWHTRKKLLFISEASVLRYWFAFGGLRCSAKSSRDEVPKFKCGREW